MAACGAESLCACARGRSIKANDAGRCRAWCGLQGPPGVEKRMARGGTMGTAASWTPGGAPGMTAAASGVPPPPRSPVTATAS